MKDKNSPAELEENIESIEVELSKPIVVFGEKKDKLVFREPTGKEFQKIGMIMSIDTEERIHFDSKRVVKMAETLADLPAGSLDSLPYKQLNKIAYAMLPFFV